MPPTPATGSGTTTDARGGRRCSSGAAAGRCAGSTSARGSTRPRRQAIQEELRALDPDLELPEPLRALRPSDAAGALVAPPSDELFPGGSESEPWRAREGDPPLELDYAAGGAWATVDGHGVLLASLDGGPELAIEVEAPGAYELAAHERHEAHHLSLGATPGVRVYSIAFPAAVP